MARGAWRSWILGVTALPCAVVAAMAYADVDQGTVNGVTYVADTSSDDPARVKVACTGGKHVTSGGFGGGFNSAEASVLAPFDGRDRNREPDDGWIARLAGGEGETVAGYAICKAGNLAYVRSKRRLVKAGRSAKGKAVCRSDLHVIGGGASVGLPAEIDQTYPADGRDRGSKPDDAWRARVDNTGGTRNRNFRVYAVCQRRMPAYRATSEVLPPGNGMAVYAECPSDRVVIGAGVKIGGEARTGAINGGVHSDDNNLNGIPEDRVYGFGSNDLGAPGPKTVTTFGVCR